MAELPTSASFSEVTTPTAPFWFTSGGRIGSCGRGAPRPRAFHLVLPIPPDAPGPPNLRIFPSSTVINSPPTSGQSWGNRCGQPVSCAIRLYGAFPRGKRAGFLCPQTIPKGWIARLASAFTSGDLLLLGLCTQHAPGDRKRSLLPGRWSSVFRLPAPIRIANDPRTPALKI